ncbi:uncharacterized protein LOC114330520 [Diabrotica virgifera virgifera]|uniref:Uncharacterized protein LOC114330520 n=1 Tax=Diabrotica virgifera virgifera TaxID=50390 RepID=A0A6P7FRR6_DIAVI|nr:uncharacterized protein LOC114330520 [Diabrotica virgifera virgifera]
MKFLITILAVALVGSTTTRAEISGPPGQNLVRYVGQLLGKCFPNQSNAEDQMYTGNNILEVLNAQAGVDIFVKTQNGIKINADIFAAILSDCIQSSLQGQGSTAIRINKRDVTPAINALLYNQEMSVQDIDMFVFSRQLNPRFRRDLAFPLNLFQEVISTIILQPLIAHVNSIFDGIDKLILSYYVDPASVTDPIQSIVINTINNAVQTVSGIIKNIKAQITELFSTVIKEGTSTTTASIQAKSKSLQTRDAFSDVIENLLVQPIRDLVNGILQTLRDLINSFAVQEKSDNPIQTVINELTNSSVSMFLQMIDLVQNQVDSILGTSTSSVAA